MNSYRISPGSQVAMGGWMMSRTRTTSSTTMGMISPADYSLERNRPDLGNNI